MSKTINSIIEIYLLVCLFIIAFVEIEASGSVPLRVFYLSQNKGYLLFMLSMVTYFTICLYGGCKIIKFDRVILLLGLKCILDLIPYIIDRSIGDAIYWYFFSMMCIMPIIYCIFRNYTNTPTKIIRYLTPFGLILIFQEVLTVFYNGYPFDSFEYKHYLRIPAAHSNIIGVILLSILCFRLQLKNKSKFGIIVNILFVIGLLIIQSTGSLLLLVCWFLLIQYKKLLMRNVILARLLIVAILVVGIVIFIKSNFYQIFFEIKSNLKITLAVLTSGRTDIWELAYLNFLQNPILGSGIGVTEYDIGYEVVTTGAHNIVLDLLVQSGLVGLFLYASAVFYGIRKAKNYNDYNKAIRIGVLVLLSYSLLEVCYFNYSCLFVCWMFIGLYNRKVLL